MSDLKSSQPEIQLFARHDRNINFLRCESCKSTTEPCRFCIDFPNSKRIGALASKMIEHLGKVDGIRQLAAKYNPDWKLIPLKPRDKRPKESYRVSDSQEKPKPLVADFNLARFDPRPNDNVGLITGRESNVFVLDFDSPKDGEQDAIDVFLKFIGPEFLGLTLTTVTGSGGYHLIFLFSDRLAKFTNSARQFNVNGKTISLDIRTDGGYIVFPPSIHPNGNGYKFLKNRHYQPASMPDSVFNLLEKMSKKQVAPVGLGKSINCKEPEFFKKANEENYTIPSLDKIREIWSKLNKDRFVNYENWWRMIRVLGNIARESQDADEILDFAIEFSSECPGYDHKTDERIKQIFSQKPTTNELTLGTIYYWLKEDIGFFAMSEVIPARDTIKMARLNTKYSFTRDYIKFSGHSISNVKVRNFFYEFIYSTVFYMSNQGGAASFFTADTRLDLETCESVRKFSAISEDDLAKKTRKVFVFRDNKEGEQEAISIWDCIWEIIPKITYQYPEFVPYSPKTPGLDRLMASMAKERVFNIFMGFPIEYDERVEISQPNIQPILDQIFYMCGEDQYATRYFINALAMMVQNPSVKVERAFLFKSEQGVGKSTFFDWFGNNIIGSELYLITDNPNVILGRFNGAAANKLLLVLEEATTFSKDGNRIGQLKSLVTRKTQYIERKNQDTANYKDFSNLIFLSNRENVLCIEKFDRRYVCLECSNRYRNNREYFDKLIEVYKDPEVTRQFYHYLMNIDISEIDMKKMPETKLKQSMAECSQKKHITFIKHLLEDHENETGLNAYLGENNGINEVVYDSRGCEPVADENYMIVGNKTQLYNAFKEFAKENYNSKSVMNSVAFGTELEKLGFVYKKHKNSKSDSRYSGKNIFCVNRAKLIETLEPMLSKPIDRELLAVHGGSDQ